MLTSKQYRYAQPIAKGNTPTATYRQVYEATDMKDGMVWNEAYKLERHAEIAMRVQGAVKGNWLETGRAPE
jgi:hypothetical protein